MIDRSELIASNPVICASERFFLIRRVARFWQGKLMDHCPNFVFFLDRPHSLSSFILYLCCKATGSPCAFVQKTPFSSVLLQDSLFSRNVSLDHYSLVQAQSFSYHHKLLINFARRSRTETHAPPEYMVQQFEDARSSNIFRFSLAWSLKNIINPFKYIKRKHFGFLSYRSLFQSSYAYENRKSFLPFENRLAKLLTFFAKWRLEKSYSRLSVNNINTKKPYIFFPLHYQPEATSLPAGGLFCDQLYVVEILKAVFPGIDIVVKEHPSQLTGPLSSLFCRWRRTYEIMRNMNVILAGQKIDQNSLIDGSLFVVTLTGTVGAEALLRNKKVLALGRSWYEHCHGLCVAHSCDDIVRHRDYLLNSSSTFDFDNYIHCLDHAIPYGCVDHDRVADGYLAAILSYSRYLDLRSTSSLEHAAI